jgi:hypothetical protein
VRSFELRSALLVVVFGFGFASVAHAQQQSSGASTQSRRTAEKKEEVEDNKVRPDAPVITIKGYCGATVIGTTDQAKCRTVVTRSEFEELTETSNADSDAAKSRIATFYAKFALLAQAAEKQGMDQDPRIKTKLELARLQTLGQAMIQDLQAKSLKYTPQELEKFFHDNPTLFELASLQRVFIPATKFIDVSPGVQRPQPGTEPEMKRVAEAIYTRAKAGADFVALQKEALETSNLKDDNVVADQGKLARRQLRQAHQVVFDLKQDEVSTLFEEKGEGYYVYKMGPREMPSFESAQTAARPLFERQRFDSWMNDITNGASISAEYFGTAAAKMGRP